MSASHDIQRSESEKASYIIVLGLLTAIGPLSIDMYLPAFSDIERTLRASSARVELSLAAFFLGFAFGQLIYGPVSDRFGRKRPLYFGLGLYALASIGATFAWNIESLIVFRFLQAIGGCAGPVISRAIVRDLFNANHAARIFSLLMLVMGLAPILAPLLGGLVTTALGWRWIFGLLSIVGVILFCAIRLLPETGALKAEGERARLSFGSAVRTYISILKDRSFLGYCLSGSLAYSGMFAYISGSPFVLIHLYGIPQSRYGFVFGANAFGLILASQINARLLRSCSFDRILRTSFHMIVAFAFYLGALAFSSPGLAPLLLGLFLYVATLGFVGPNFSAGALSHQKGKAGSASALLGTIQFLVAFGASLLVGQLHDGTLKPMVLVMAGCGLAPLLVYHSLVPNRHKI